MSQQCVVAIYNSFDKAKDGVQALEEAKFPHEQVSFVTHSIDDELYKENALEYADKTERNAAKGAGMGGLIGLLLGAPLMTVNGVGAILIAGPVAMGLAGAIVGGFLGAMSGWGVDADHVQRYEAMVSDGAFLLVVNSGPQEVTEAVSVLARTEAEEVRLHAKTSADTAQR